MNEGRVLALVIGVAMVVPALVAVPSGQRPAPPPTATTRITSLTELCTFKLPQGNYGGKNGGFEYGGTALAFNPTRGTLLIVGHLYDQMTAEITVPECGGTATVVSRFTDVLDGKLRSINDGDPNRKLIGGQLLYKGKLYVSGFSYYDGAGTQTVSHFFRPAE